MRQSDDNVFGWASRSRSHRARGWGGLACSAGLRLCVDVLVLPVSVAFHSFGGWRDSLFGDLHAYGPDAVRFYTRRKADSTPAPLIGVGVLVCTSFVLIRDRLS
ncbi:hypothetical protein SAMN04487959_12139 [Modicisalibacter xianhensis]|uniref:Uncharacterized protein n=1 Tax=Modicisalibacter xianhensis TaxID=442341 RepID=A0A1I3FUN8_9GAMM|nr:hypothetical protein SAMN04487959_12139 [Halomonas xianhensis]